MSSPLYAVRVLELDPADRRVRLRVVVFYYDGAVEGLPDQPLPRDASFFEAVLLDETDPWALLGAEMPRESLRFADEDWREANCARFIERVQQLEIRNHPPLHWPNDDHEIGRRWRHEDRLTQATYDVWVVDPRWLEHLSVGQTWDTTAYDVAAYGYESSLWSTRRAQRHEHGLVLRDGEALPWAGREREVLRHDMGLDVYGIRVLEVDRDGLRVRFQVFLVLFFDRMALPTDASFFLCLLRDGAIADVFEDEAWASEHCVRFIDRIEQIELRNRPPVQEVRRSSWRRVARTSDGVAWEDEDQLPQAIYDVWVTDARWIEHLSVGQEWAHDRPGAFAYGYESATWSTHRRDIA